MESYRLQERLAEVRQASASMLECQAETHAMATRQYLSRRSEPLTNTFLNFMVEAPQSAKRTARSVDCGICRSTEAQERELPVASRTLADKPVCDEECSKLDGAAFASSASTCYPSSSSCYQSFGSTASAMSSSETSSAPMDALASALFQRLQRCYTAEDTEADAIGVEETQEDGDVEDSLEQQVAAFEASEEDGTAAGSADRSPTVFTTVMMQNLPRVFMQQDLLNAIDAAGYEGQYNFLHMPVSFSNGMCRGYAFINFDSHDAAARFLAEWDGARNFCDKKHRKALMVTLAQRQGLDALLSQSSMRKLNRVKNAAFRPFLRP